MYPNLAKREHLKNLPALFEQFKDDSYDAVAVTHGPGLEPALWTGIEFAKKLAAEKNLPLLPTNHMEGHIISSLVQNGRLENIQLPVLALLVSGGHTELVLTKSWFKYEIVGKTLDDAVGEAFDKVARMLGLPYPGGPEISKLAQKHRGSQKLGQKNGLVEAEPTRGPFSGQVSAMPKLPRPMLNSGTCDFSFSGLKTAALYALRDLGGIQKLSADEIAAFAAEFEDAVADVFVAKARKALIDTGAQTFVIGGGVAANSYIREQLQKMVLDEFPDVEYRLPHLGITGDNAIMIAEAALCHLLTGDWHEPPKEFKATGNLSIAQKML
ncbi:MAG: tRNA (adenosine(37)-N6)-threonylcarbamoyltransferase complex transferase subunit TsaD [Patescibacteria group bacterium]